VGTQSEQFSLSPRAGMFRLFRLGSVPRHSRRLHRIPSARSARRRITRRASPRRLPRTATLRSRHLPLTGMCGSPAALPAPTTARPATGTRPPLPPTRTGTPRRHPATGPSTGRPPGAGLTSTPSAGGRTSTARRIRWPGAPARLERHAGGLATAPHTPSK
jgi:hypothetical protein